MTDVARNVHIAIVGFGRMGKIYARAITEMDGARLYAVATDDLAAEESFLKELGVHHLFRDAGGAFALDEVDAVVIATPTNTHRRLVLEAAAAGKDIFCEKPLALTLEDTRVIIDAVGQAGVLLQVGFMRRYDPAYRDAKAAIVAGKIGRPVTFKAVGRDPFCPDPEYADPAHSGGLIIDMAIHDMDAARWLMDAEVGRVTAEGTTMVCGDLEKVGDIDNAVINLRFDNGAIGNVEVSRNAFYGYDVRTEVLGSKSAVRVGGDPTGASTLREPKSGAGEEYLVRRFGDAYDAQIRDFVTCVRRNRPPECSGEAALAAFEISLAATYAVRTGEPVTIAAIREGWAPSNTDA